MHSDLYFYLRDKRASKRFDRTGLQVSVVLMVAAFVGFGFCMAYGVAIIG